MKIKIFLCILFSLFFAGCSASDGLVIEADLPETSTVFEEDCDDDCKESIYVSIQGEVCSPGVFVMPFNSRVFDIINEAGGLTDTADVSKINLVSPLSDGMQIFVPSYAKETDMEMAEASGLVNINAATVSELMTLPGIGNAKATAIVQYRENHGLFTSIEEIKEVSGIKENTFENIKENICAN